MVPLPSPVRVIDDEPPFDVSRFVVIVRLSKSVLRSMATAPPFWPFDGARHASRCCRRRSSGATFRWRRRCAGCISRCGSSRSSPSHAGFDVTVSAGVRVVALAVAVAAVRSVPDRARTVRAGHRAVPVAVTVRGAPVRVVVRTVDVRRVVPAGAVPRHTVSDVHARAVRRRVRIDDGGRRRFVHGDLRHRIRRRDSAESCRSRRARSRSRTTVRSATDDVYHAPS